MEQPYSCSFKNESETPAFEDLWLRSETQHAKKEKVTTEGDMCLKSQMREGSTLSWGEKEGWTVDVRLAEGLEAEEGICRPGRTFQAEPAARANMEPVKGGKSLGGCLVWCWWGRWEGRLMKLDWAGPGCPVKELHGGGPKDL